MTNKSCRLPGVVAGAMADFVIQPRLGEGDFDAAEFGVGKLLLGVIADQVLRAQFLRDLMEGGIELGDTRGIVMFPTSIVGELDQGILATNVASGVGLDGND